MLGWPGTGKQIAESALAESAKQRVVKMAVVNCIVGRLLMILGCIECREEMKKMEQRDIYIYVYQQDFSNCYKLDTSS